MRLLVVAGVALVAAVCATHVGAAPSPAADVRLLAAQIEALHPQPFRATSRARFRAAATALAARAASLERDQLVVELMRLVALLGPRNGHSGIFPGDPAHQRSFHLYPLRLYAFVDGLHVVAAVDAPDLVGAKVLTVAGRPLDEVAARVTPIVPRDNDSHLRGLWPHYLLTAEVLHGLGVVDDTGSVVFGLRLRDGREVERTLAPIDAAEYVSAFPDPFVGHYPSVVPPAARPLAAANAARDIWLTTLDRGRVVYLGYNSARARVYEVTKRLERLARRPSVRRIVVDVRRNPGGDNTTFGGLVAALGSDAIDRPGRLYLLVGRATFSAAGNFAAEVESSTGAVVLGEPTGGGLDIYGDTSPVELPGVGVTAQIARIRHVRGRPGDRRLSVQPDVRIDVTSAAWLAGRDPVLARALAR